MFCIFLNFQMYHFLWSFLALYLPHHGASFLTFINFIIIIFIIIDKAWLIYLPSSFTFTVIIVFFFFNIYSQQSTFCPSILLSVSSQWNTAEHFHCFFELSDYVTVLSFNYFFVTLNRELKFSFLMFFYNFGIISENVSFEFSLSDVVSEPKPYALILDFFSYKVQ